MILLVFLISCAIALTLVLLCYALCYDDGGYSIHFVLHSYSYFSRTYSCFINEQNIILMVVILQNIKNVIKPSLINDPVGSWNSSLIIISHSLHSHPSHFHHSHFFLYLFSTFSLPLKLQRFNSRSCGLWSEDDV